MTTPESSHIGQERGRVPRETGSLSSANFPPLDPKKEGPTERDIHLSNADIQTIETRLAALLSRNQNKEGIGRDLLLIGGTSLATTALVLGGQFLINKVFAAENENADSFRNTFNPADGERLEFQSPQIELPPVIDPKNPDKINISFPIEFAQGSEDREIKVRRYVDWMGGGVRHHLDSDDQSVGKFYVKNAFIIKDGLKDGDILRAPASGILSSGGTIKGEDQAGNKYTIMMGGYLNLEYIKKNPPSRTEEVGPGRYRVIESYVPVEQGEHIGIIRNPSKGIIGPQGAGGTGQFYLYAFSTVVIEDGLKQQGAAAIVTNNLPHNLKIESSN